MEPMIVRGDDRVNLIAAWFLPERTVGVDGISK